MLIGFPDLLTLRPTFFSDEAGVHWVELGALAVTLILEGPSSVRDPEESLRLIEPMVLQGPGVFEVPAVCRGAQSGAWVRGQDWPGVRVVERPLAEGEQIVQVAVEPTVRAVLTVAHCPWRTGVPDKLRTQPNGEGKPGCDNCSRQAPGEPGP